MHLAPVAQAVTIFVATNLDDLVVLMVLIGIGLVILVEGGAFGL